MSGVKKEFNKTNECFCREDCLALRKGSAQGLYVHGKVSLVSAWKLETVKVGSCRSAHRCKWEGSELEKMDTVNILRLFGKK